MKSYLGAVGILLVAAAAQGQATPQPTLAPGLGETAPVAYRLQSVGGTTLSMRTLSVQVQVAGMAAC
jgi:hypothetical protein